MSQNSHELTKEKIDDAIGLCKSYAKTRRSQMQRGLNDFNVFTCLLEEHDEVRLHSRFIHSLLDINGAHGQGDFFLGLFLKECKLDDVGMNTKNCRAYKEYNHIDLYITDGSRHIIIENKIYAGPQDRQIERYIETIKEENPDDNDLSKNLVVVYLSLGRDKPDEKSLGKYRIVGNEIVREVEAKREEEAEKYKFLSIHYGKEILGWIQSCKTQVSNITNLSVGLTQYEEVILSLDGRKKDKLMKLKNYIEENKDNELEVLRDLRKVNQEYTSLREDYIQEVLHESADLIRKKIPAGWKVELKELKEVDLRGNDRTALVITQSELEKPALAFRFGFDARDYQNPLYAVCRASNTVDLTWLKDNDEMKDELYKIKQKLRYSDLPWWPAWERYHEGDMFDFIIGEGGVNKAANTIVEKFWGMFESYKEFVEKCNKEYLSRAEQS